MPVSRCSPLNVPTRSNRRAMTDEQVEEAVGLYASGLSLLSVGRHFHVNASTIKNEFVRAGLAVRPRRGGTAQAEQCG
ncbi:hypothetical protein BH24ACT5_BH24ACT5_23440 [soil metagenome]